MRRLAIHQLDSNGATTTQVLRFNGTSWENATLDAADVGTGQFVAARLGGGTADSTTFLRGDGAWAVPPSAGGGATTLDQLTDVDTSTTAPTNGQALVYDSTAGLWKPATVSGGVDVGSWQQSTAGITVPGLTEFDLQASPAAIPTARPATAQVSFTVTSAMLCSTSSDVGYSNVLYVLWSINESGMGATSVAMSFDLVVNGVTSTSGNSSGHMNTRRGNGIVGYTGASVGDVVEFRLWAAATGAVLDWWARTARPSRVFKTPPTTGGRWLYHNVKQTGTAPVVSPTTTLTTLGTRTTGSPGTANSPGAQYFYRESTVGTTAPAGYEMFAPDPSLGIVKAGAGDQVPSTSQASTGWLVYSPDYATAWSFDRLQIPTPPATV